jgi:signal peptidase I
MYPVLRDNDLVVVRETAPELLRKGNILVYHQEEKGEYLVHRLVKKGKGDILYLRGDGYDLSVELTRIGAIMGKAIGFVRNSRYEPLNRLEELRSWSVSLLKEYSKHFIRRAFRLNRQNS